MQRRHILATLLALPLAAAFPALGQAQQDFPNKPVRLIVPFAPGGTTDTVSRRVAQELSVLWGQPVVIENKPGAGTTIGVNTVAKAEADGYTLGTVTGSFTVNHTLMPNLPYDTKKDLRAVAAMAGSDHVLVVNPSVPVNTVDELVAMIQSQPGQVSYASFGNGSSAHLAGEMLAMHAKAPMIHVPYKGQTPAMTDVIAGQVQVMFANLPEALPQIKAGKLKALGVAAAQRSDFAPDIPTLAEQGVTGITSSSWNGLIAPAGTPDAVVAKINADVNRVLETPAVRDSFAEAGIAVTPGTPEAFGAFLDKEMQHYGDIIRQANITAG